MVTRKSRPPKTADVNSDTIKNHSIYSEEWRPMQPETNQLKEGVEALQLAEMIIANSPAVLFCRLAHPDPKHRKMVYVSSNISRFGYPAEDFISGKVMFRDIIYPEDSERTLKEIQSFVSRKIQTYTQVYRIVTRRGEVRWIEDRTSIVRDAATGVRYHQGIVVDIHKRKEAEEKLRKSEEKYRRIVDTAGEGFLLMDEGLRIVDLNLAYARMVGCTRAELIGKNPFAADTEQYQRFWPVMQEDTSNDKYREFECQISSCEGRNIPVLIHANTLRSDEGAIVGNMAFVTDMTEQKKALLLAGEVQRSLLPDKVPYVHGLDIAGKSVSCDEVGGDYFDFLWDGVNTPFTVAVGDVTGHGVDSALLMTSARAFLRMRSSQPGSITDIVMAINHHLTEDVHATGRFMTLLYFTIDEGRNSVEWVRAGHEPALIYDPCHDQFEELMGPGLALGVDQDYGYRSHRKSGLKPGVVIAAGTDGIWEGCNGSGEMFGKERFKNIIRRHSMESAQTILDMVFREHMLFSRGVNPEDDITLVIVKVV